MRGPLRRLALVLEPHSGESLLSWIDALARLNRVSRPTAQRMAGMANSGAVSTVFGYHVSEATAHVVSRTTGLTGEQVRSMTLARYAGIALDPLPQHDPEGHGALAKWRYRQRMVLRQRSNVCPPCLRESGSRWLLKWRLAWSFACVRHQQYLLSRCRGCGAVLHPLRPGTPTSWICPGPAPGLGLYTPKEPCGRDIRRMRAKPVHDTRLLACQQRIDRLLGGQKDVPQEEARAILKVLYRSMQDAWSAVRPLQLPQTDDVVHLAWDRYLAPKGYQRQYRPLVVAAALKIVTEAGLEAAADSAVNGGEREFGQARPNWGRPLPLRTGVHGEIEALANPFGGYCRHTGCLAWVPAGCGAMLGSATGWDTYCPQHADDFTVRARSRERTDSTAFTNPYATHPDFRTAWLPRQGENPALPAVRNAVGDAGPGTAGEHG